MSEKFRARVIFCLVVIAVVVAGWWVFHFPFRPELVYRVIPERATAASRHLSPSLRVNALCDSAIVTNVAGVLGVDGEDLLDLIEDYGSRKLIDIIGDKQVITAFVPSMGGYGQCGYIFGAWVGGYSQLLRWGLLDSVLTNFSMHRLAGNRRVWVCECPEIKPGYFLSLAVHEGVLVGCLSAEKFGVLYIMPRLMDQRPVAAIADKWCDSADGAADEFLATVELPEDIGTGSVELHGLFSKVSAQGIVAELEIMPDSDAFAVWNKYFANASLRLDDGGLDVLGNSPDLFCAMPVSSIEPFADLFESEKANPWNKLGHLFRKDEPACMFACGDGYYGHIMRMKVPTLGVMLPMADGIEGDVAVRTVIDELNAIWKWGLIATPDSHDKRIRVINSVRSGGYKLVHPNERPAIAICDGWMVVLSNVDVLRRILRDSEGASNDWYSLPTTESTVMYGWSDLEETSDMLKNALYGYTLVSLLQKNSSKKRRDTSELKMAISVLGKLGELAVWLSVDGANPKLKAELIF